jgi:hypothetical protein
MPRLQETAAGFTLRPSDKIKVAVKGAYDGRTDPVVLLPGLGVVVDALNSGDIGREDQ